MKKLTILGSTGSIGTNTLNIVSLYPDKFKVAALSADSNVDLLLEQIKKFRPREVAVKDRSKAALLKKRLGRRSGLKIYESDNGICEMAAKSRADIAVIAISGTAALMPTVEAIKSGKQIALASKEALVTAGGLITDLAKRKNVKIIPVDSEHSAIFQCLDGKGAMGFLSKIYLTGSGGPLRNVLKKDFDKLSHSEILNHPKWKMGKKITVDSATLMNKGLEVIEAHWLFGVDVDNVEVIIHPEAIVHSMVEFVDGSVMAQLALPDMKLPILYALTYPERYKTDFPRADFSAIRNLTFYKADAVKFPCLRLAYEAIKKGGSYPCVLNAANEEAVRAYLKGAIKFSKIPLIIEQVLKRHKYVKAPSLEDILNIDSLTKEEVKRHCSRF